MIWDVLAPMIVLITLILTTGGVILLRPLTRRLADLLQVMTQERIDSARPQELAKVRDLLAAVEGRLSLLEERQGFTESLLEVRQLREELARGRAALPEPGPEAAASDRLSAL